MNISQEKGKCSIMTKIELYWNSKNVLLRIYITSVFFYLIVKQIQFWYGLQHFQKLKLWKVFRTWLLQNAFGPGLTSKSATLPCILNACTVFWIVAHFLHDLPNFKTNNNQLIVNPLVPKTHTFFGDNLKKQHPQTKVLVHLPLLSNNQNKNQHPTPLYISLGNTLVPWSFRFGGYEILFWRFCIWWVRFWCNRR